MTLLPPNMPPPAPSERKADYRLLNDEELETILSLLPKQPLLAGTKNIRLSLAGVQDKIAVAVMDGNIHLPLNGAASSHIIKPASLQFTKIVHNEHICLKLASMVGITTVATEVRKVGNIEYLLIKRYDRSEEGRGIFHRIHQEDFCQALGIASECKYQNEGGPSLVQCFDLIRAHSTVPALDVAQFLDTILYHYLIGNCDAHGKNFSFIFTEKSTRLAPLYDSVSTVIYPNLSQKMAMRIGKHYERSEINKSDWQAFAASCKLSEALVFDRLQALSEKLQTVLHSMPVSAHPMIAKLLETVYTQTK